MAISRAKARQYAIQRRNNPSPNELRLIQIMGASWLKQRGFVREYEIPTATSRLFLDFAQPKLKINIETDGEHYHMDVVKDMERDAWLRQRGWYVHRFRTATLINKPDYVRQTIETIYKGFAPKSFRDRLKDFW